MLRSSTWYRLCCAAAALVAAAGCSSPLDDQSTQSLRDSVVESAQRELREAEGAPAPYEMTRTPSELTFPPERLTELESMAGPAAYTTAPPAPGELGPDLLGEQTRVFQIDLNRAIITAVSNNLAAQAAQLDPAISAAQVTAAEAAFDWVFFTNYQWDNTDSPRQLTAVAGVPIGSFANVSQSHSYETGIRKRATSGGVFTVSQGQQYLDVDSPGVSLFPDPSNQTFVRLRADQPILRGFGSDTALAEVRLTQNLERRTIQDLKRTLIDTATETERAYWNLVRARRNLQILQSLLARGLETRDVLKARIEFDVKPAEYSDAVATVARRQSNITRAINDLRQASDRLKVLMNDPELSVGSESVLIPLDAAVDAPITFSFLDLATTALRERPEVQQAILSIDDAAIRQEVADNARLPQLDIAAQMQFTGLAAGVGDSYEQITESQFVDYLLGAFFETPIGNRAAQADYRRRQLERMQATIDYRASVQFVVADVKTALRNVGTNYQLIEQTRTSRRAAAENLRTLLVQEKTIQSLTPDFLDLKFRRQEALALAESDEVEALVGYNIALADLYASTGTALDRNRIKFEVEDAGRERR